MNLSEIQEEQVRRKSNFYAVKAELAEVTDELEKLAVEHKELVALHSGCDDALAALRAELAQVDSGELMSDSLALSGLW